MDFNQSSSSAMDDRSSTPVLDERSATPLLDEPYLYESNPLVPSLDEQMLEDAEIICGQNETDSTVPNNEESASVQDDDDDDALDISQRTEQIQDRNLTDNSKQNVNQNNQETTAKCPQMIQDSSERNRLEDCVDSSETSQSSQNQSKSMLNSETKADNISVTSKTSSSTNQIAEGSSSLFSNDKFSTPASLEKKLKCSECCFTTTDDKMFKNHICLKTSRCHDAHKEKQISITFSENHYHCNECDFKAKGHAFEEHLMCHLIVKPYQCIYCPEAFVNRREMGQHVSVKHTGEKMSCALKALSRARKLMCEAKKTNSYVFFATVAGKVPLQIDPEKSEVSKPKQGHSETTHCSAVKPEKTEQKGKLTERNVIITSSSHNRKEKTGNEVSDNTDNLTLTHHINKDKPDQADVDKDINGKEVTKTSVKKVTNEKNVEIHSAVNESSTKDLVNEEQNSSLQTSSQSSSLSGSFNGVKDVDMSDNTASNTTFINNKESICDSENHAAIDESDPVNEEQKCSAQSSSGVKDTDLSDNLAADTIIANNKEYIFDSDKAALETEYVLVPRNSETSDEHEDDSVSIKTDTSVSEMLQREDLQTSQSEYNEENEIDSMKEVQTTQDDKTEAINDQATVTGGGEIDKDDKLDKIIDDAEQSLSQSQEFVQSISEQEMEQTRSETQPSKEDGQSLSEEPNLSEQLSQEIEENLSEHTSQEIEENLSEHTSQEIEENLSEYTSQEIEGSLSEKPCQEIEQTLTEHTSQEGGQSLAEHPTQEDEEGLSEQESREEANEMEVTESENIRTEEMMESVSESNTSEMTVVEDSKPDSPAGDEEQELKIVDSFSLDADDNSFQTELISNRVTEEEKLIDDRSSKESSKYSAVAGSGSSSNSDDDANVESSTVREKKTLMSGLILKKPTILERVLTSPQGSPQLTPPNTSVKTQITAIRNPNFYICGLGCSFSCLNSVEFRDHLMLDHAGETGFPCFYCGWSSSLEDGLLKHMISHAHTYNKAAPLYCCGVVKCKFGTNLLADYKNHMEIMHAGCTSYKCKECDYMADNVQTLVQHFDNNFLHVVNCPHCTCKGSDRGVILRHIAQFHPGKAKMVQVAKQMICKERKQNNYHEKQQTRIITSNMKTEILSVNISVVNNDSNLQTKQTDSMEKHIESPKCDHCTFVARDARRLQSHKNCHGLPQIKRHRFRCIYCPQGFDAATKFKSHIVCHPGLIKYWIYCCKYCEFDTNQRHVMLKHVKNRDDGHMHSGSDEDMFTIVEQIMESRVLECEHCNFQTRHKLHLQIHCEQQHKVVKAAAQSSTDLAPLNSSLSFKTPSLVSAYSKQTRGSGGQVQENRLKKFKCPHCQYLVPKAADLKQHMKRHDYLGKISLNIFRCKYCSSSSTARDLVFEHIREKHAGKALQLVRKTVNIDTSGTDNTFSETSVAEAPLSSNDYNPHNSAINPVMPISSSNPVIDRFHCETCSFSTPSRDVFDNHLLLHNTKGGVQGMASPDPDDDSDEGDTSEIDTKPSADKQIEDEFSEDMEKIIQVIIVPDCVAADTLTAPVRCPQCYFASGYRSAFVSHVKSLHPLVMVIIRNNGGVQEVSESGNIGKPFHLPEDLNPEILIIPEKQVFSQSVSCPKCPNFVTYFRRNLVLHIQKHHSEVTAMGYRSWNGWRGENVAGTSQGQTLKSLQDESCIVGSGNLDEKIGMLYENYGAKQKCLICTLEKSKKYFMHIHLLRHLDICLWKCAYCAYKGLEKHKIKQHIKEHHPDQPATVTYLNVDIDNKVAEFVKQLGLNRNQTFLSSTEKESFPEITVASSPKLLSISPDSKMKQAGPLGTADLDEKIRCLYETVYNKSRCILCSCEFTRKFAIHRHIVTNHLKIALIGCGYCSFTGVDKHYITDHILMQHPSSPIKVIALDINIPQKVTELLSSPNPGKRGSDNGGDLDTSESKSQQDADSTPKAYFLGKDLLDQKLQCLYRKQPDGFKCKVCEWKFPRKYACHRHIFLKHLKLNLFGCAYCHAKAVERYLIISHIKEAHPGSPPHAQILKVDIDKKISEFLAERSQVAETLSNIKQNTDSHSASADEFLPEQKPDLDEINGSGSGMVVALFGRKRKDSDTVFPSVLSPVSPKKLKTTCRMTDVTTNIKVICVAEGSLKKYVCEVCRFTSLHRSNVYRHVLRVHEKYREQECQYCGYKTLSVVLMQQHIDIEHESEALSSKTSEDSKETITVKKEPNEETKSSEDEEEAKEVKDEHVSTEADTSVQHTIKTYCCAYCDYETQTSEDILKHTKQLHCQTKEIIKPSTSSATTPASSSSSSPCYSKPVLKTNVKKGMFSANQYLSCGYCSYKSASLPDIKSHAKSEHRIETALIVSPYAWKYICKICSLKNSAAGKMKNHINRHIEYRPYTCGSCGTSYCSSDELRKHIKNYQHADEILYIKNEKKEKKVSQLMADSRRCAEMINLGTPFNFDCDKQDEENTTEKHTSPKRMYNKSPVKKITSTWKTEVLGNSVKFKFVKKKSSSGQKTKFRYAQNCPFAKRVPVRVSADKNTTLMKKDCYSCCRCNFTTAVNIEEVKKHHEEVHKGEEFLWQDSRLQVKCTESGRVVRCPSQMKMPPVDEQFTHKQLSGKSTKFYCIRCEFSCWVLQAIKSHLRMHQPRRFLCPYCNMRYHKRDNVDKHLASIHPHLPVWVVHIEETEDTVYIDSKSEEEDMDESTTEEKPAVAKTKKKKQKSKLLGPKTKRHQRLMAEYKELTSKGQPLRRTSQSVLYCCNQCNFTNESLYLFRLHLATHGNFCHLVTDLTSESPLKCGFCPYVAEDQTDFSTHVETHFDMRNFKCGHCSYSAYTKAHVRSHLANFHSGFEEKVIDTTSLALADSLNTNMPKLVNLDPQVVLDDIMYLDDDELAKLMPLADNPLFDFTIPTSAQSLVNESENNVEQVKYLLEDGTASDVLLVSSTSEPNNDDSVNPDTSSEMICESEMSTVDTSHEFELNITDSSIVIGSEDASVDNENKILEDSDLCHTEHMDDLSQERSPEDKMDEVDGLSHSDVPTSSGYDDPGNVFNTLNSWLSNS